MLLKVFEVKGGFAIRNRKVLEKEKTLMVRTWALGSLPMSAICLNSDPTKKILGIANMYCPHIILGGLVRQGVEI